MTLAELIDFERALASDRDRSLEFLTTRDRQIASSAAPEQQAGEALFVHWLARVRNAGDDSAGARVERLLRSASLILFFVGLILGASLVSTWLVTRNGLPLNVVKFWLVLVGSQLLLLALAAVAMLPPRVLDAIPVLGEIRSLLASAAQALPNALLFLLRLAPFRGAAADGQGASGFFLAADGLYRRALFWRLVSLTQRFAIGFNLGAIAALFLIPYLDDPAFGWRSRLLDPATTASLATTIAWPWAWCYDAGTLPAEVIAATQYSSLDPALARLRVADGPWSAWWPFLLCSLAVYGLLPRIFFFCFAQWRGRLALARAPFDDVDCQRLRTRLEHVGVETRAQRIDRVEGDASAEATGSADPPTITLRDRRCVLVVAPDFSAERDLGDRIVERHAASILREARPDDVVALREVAIGLRNDPPDVVLLAVPAFEPPVGERLESVLALREGAGATQLIVVVLEQPGGVEARHLSVWRRTLATRGDRYLDVLVASESEDAA